MLRSDENVMVYFRVIMHSQVENMLQYLILLTVRRILIHRSLSVQCLESTNVHLERRPRKKHFCKRGMKWLQLDIVFIRK